MQFELDDISDAELERRRGLYGPLAEAVRELIDATIRTEADDDTVRAATRTIAGVTKSLRDNQIDGSYGVRFTRDGIGMPWGNAVIGMRNPIAPPITTELDADGLVTTEFHLGAAYEGPPACVHGGVVAMILDHVLGVAGSADDVPCYTGTISVRYLRPTSLGDLRASAVIVEREGRKKIVRGALADADGETATAEGVFIVPKDWEGPMPRQTRTAEI